MEKIHIIMEKAIVFEREQVRRYVEVTLKYRSVAKAEILSTEAVHDIK